jgi:hypothetical protein
VRWGDKDKILCIQSTALPLLILIKDQSISARQQLLLLLFFNFAPNIPILFITPLLSPPLHRKMARRTSTTAKTSMLLRTIGARALGQADWDWG